MGSEPRRVVGATFPATADGFRKFLNEAEKAQGLGWDLVTLVKLEKRLAAVWKRQGSLNTYDGFCGEDDEAPVFSYR